MAGTAGQIPPTFVVEHLDPELGPWSALEYKCIAEELGKAGAKFMLTSVPKSLRLPQSLASQSNLGVEHQSVEELFVDKKPAVCLLDPAAVTELSPADGTAFQVFLFGGILVFWVGDHPPRDRTSELRKKGYAARRLGPKQMTTDTAVRVTRIVTQEKAVPLSQIPWLDFPEIRVDKRESIEMPFRYVKGPDGEPIMPEGMSALIKQDADKAIEDLL
ncbi:DUF431 domain-containing protein [Nannizzia gypsea CBS 118893]|uniref:DUF431 domain-containing protein n=1 Tax=Arthroderma gypseum (strain ATCC MYA-4604 / CBS 118893) TaxID=535722 RepID=E5QZG6_ARTGP|nr:DUF431 domain-containing protein [Nannizzia gypsea CBS 118893]EFQ98971.1 DUF431 domain-containing protein [Nannizzia gypsea CBS 118893]